MLKKINGYWMDENNNRWDTKIYTKEQAEKFSKSLVDCYNCYNCDNCYNCRYCDYCNNCHNCHQCSYCGNCRYSSNCYNCYDCRYCDYCNNCNYSYHCRNCYHCCDCDYCCNCNNYKSDPQRYTTDRIGSRNDKTTFYYGETENNKNEIQVICGCFRGNLEDFEKAILKTHKDNDLYRKQYLKEIEKVKILFDLELE